MFSFFSKNKTSNPSTPSPVAVVENVSQHPPFTQGVPAVGTDAIVKSQHELITKIRSTLQFNQQQFKRLVLPIINGYAAYTHLLPASEAHHHCDAGGLCRHGLEVGFWAAQRAQSYQFASGNTSQQRRESEPRWQFAVFLSGLLHDIGKPLSVMTITDKNGKEWNPYVKHLAAWIADESVERYFVRWRQKRGQRYETFAMMPMHQILTAEAIAYLNSDGPDIMEALLEAIAGTGIGNDITRIMLWADQESVRRNLVDQPRQEDENTHGVPVERFVFDALRRIVVLGNINQPGALIWHLQQGVFLVWDQLVPELHALLKKDKIQGIPSNPSTLAAILIERGFAIAYQETIDAKPQAYWPVYPDLLQGMRLNCLRLSDTALAFVNPPPMTVQASLIKPLPMQKADAVDTLGASDTSSTQVSDSSVAHADKRSTPAAEIATVPPLASAVGAPESPPVAEPVVAPDDNPSLVTAAVTDTEPAALTHADVDVHMPQIHEHPDIPETRDSTLPDKATPTSPGWKLIDTALDLFTSSQTAIEKLVDGGYGIPYPDAARLLGEPRDIMNQLAEANLLRIDPSSPSKTTLVGGKKYLLLSQEVKAYIVSARSSAKTPVSAPDKD
ncbi:MAG: TraI domain-containing protein [Cellvibrionaceae bacterium]|nr:TraI domain-containing protein [Cellvibrionaceae bacterium]